MGGCPSFPRPVTGNVRIDGAAKETWHAASSSRKGLDGSGGRDTPGSTNSRKSFRASNRCRRFFRRGTPAGDSQATSASADVDLSAVVERQRAAVEIVLSARILHSATVEPVAHAGPQSIDEWANAAIATRAVLLARVTAFRARHARTMAQPTSRRKGLFRPVLARRRALASSRKSLRRENALTAKAHRAGLLERGSRARSNPSTSPRGRSISGARETP